MPPEDVRAELVPNPTFAPAARIRAGRATSTAPVGDRTEPFLAWHYLDPLDEMERITGRICFFNERVDLSLDGELQARPRTAWSGTDWAKEHWARA